MFRPSSSVVALAILVLAACGGSKPSAPSSSPPPTVVAAAAPATTTAASPKCTPRDAEQTRILQSLTEQLGHGTETGAIRSDHEQLFRSFPGLHEGAVVTSIAPTYGVGPHGPIFAVTLLVRNASRDMDVHLGFATAPCPDGELALTSTPVPLGAKDAVVRYVVRVPFAASPLTELQLEVSSAPLTGGQHPHPRSVNRSVVVGAGAGALGVALPKGATFGIIGAIDDLDAELAAERSIKRRDVHLFGSGWYAFAGGAAYMLTHQVAYDIDDLCREKRAELPSSPPMLRLIARLDASKGFRTLASSPDLGTAWVVAVGDNQPTEPMMKATEHTLRSGPTAVVVDGYFSNGPPAQWFFGLFDSASAADATARSLKPGSGSVFATEPAAGAPPAKEPWTIPVRRSPSATRLNCALRARF